MTIEVMLMIGVVSMLVIISLLLLSVLKGIADTLDQRKEFFIKQSEWMNDIYNFIFDANNISKKNKVIIGEEQPEVDHQAMFIEGLKEIEKLNNKKHNS
jgi:hypothetical protein